MSYPQITNTLAAPPSRSASAGSAFATSLTLRVAELRAQSFKSLLDSVRDSSLGRDQAASGLDFLGTPSAANDPLAPFAAPAAAGGLSADGRNLSLFDPESAYRMMSIINGKDALYKAQFSELSAMQEGVAAMQQSGQCLAGLDATLDGAGIEAELQAFAEQYNAWIARFDGSVQRDGLLAGTQAAEVSLYELEQSVGNPFFGAQAGFRGMRDLGLTIDQNTNLVSLDSARLESALASDRGGVVATLREFGANFARSAELLNAENNFIPRQLDNLDRAIDYVADNQAALQQEFGRGDAPRLSVALTQAIAAYEEMKRGA